MKRSSQVTVRAVIAGAAAALVLGMAGVASAAQDLPRYSHVVAWHPGSFQEAEAEAALQCASYALIPNSIMRWKGTDGRYHVDGYCQ